MDALELLVNKGRNIPVRLELLPQLESQLNGAKTWKDRTARTFLRKNSHYTLMEVSAHAIFVIKCYVSISFVPCRLNLSFSFLLHADEINCMYMQVPKAFIVFESLHFRYFTYSCGECHENGDNFSQIQCL